MKKSSSVEVIKLKKMAFKPIMCIISIIIFMANITGCAKKSKVSEEKEKINVYIDIKDKDNLEVIRSILDEYKKENKDTELVLNSLLVDNKLEEDLVEGKIDLLIIPREKMIALSKKGLLSDMDQVHTSHKLNERYYNITASYGRIGDKYFGLALMPSIIEAIYNPEALKKLNMETPKDIKELLATIKKINGSGNKIPVKLPEDIDIKQLPAAVFFSNLADMEKIEETYGSSKEGYSKLQLQPVFDTLNRLVKEGYLNEDSFEVATDGTIDRLINGDIPLVIADSSITKDIKDSKLEVVKEYSITDTKNKVPVISSGLVCIPANSKNEETVNNIIGFIYEDKMQEKLADMGYVTGNKKVNKKKWLSGPNKDISQHLEEADAESIFYLHNFPNQFKPNLESAVISILQGKYTGREWEELVNKSAK